MAHLPSLSLYKVTPIIHLMKHEYSCCMHAQPRLCCSSTGCHSVLVFLIPCNDILSVYCNGMFVHEKGWNSGYIHIMRGNIYVLHCYISLEVFMPYTGTLSRQGSKPKPCMTKGGRWAKAWAGMPNCNGCEP